MALDLGVSRYDHSCRPNCSLVFDGYRAVLRPLTPETKADDWKVARIAYVDVGRSKYQRRKELKSKWYFECECDRCLDPEDNRLSAIPCSNNKCDEPLLITEDEEPIGQACRECGVVTSEEKVAAAQKFMLSLPNKLNTNSEDKESVQWLKDAIKAAEQLLHKENIYYSRLLLAYSQVSGGEYANVDMHKLVYNNYKRCFPNADRHVGFQLLHIVKGLIEVGKRPEAIEYAYEAMRIFEVCFGMDHPYYLQTLALWTFLDKGPYKSDDQLFTLMNFDNNKPVDIAPLLKMAEQLKVKA